MANPEQLNILKQGVQVWNKWRKENLGIEPDFREANLIEADLSLADLSLVDFTDADLSSANLDRANLNSAILNKANLTRANLSWANLTGANLIKANLTGANLIKANLTWANLTKANLNNANSSRADLTGSDFSNANMENATIFETIFADTNLSETKGLDKLKSVGSSTVDHRTLMKSKKLSEKFLSDCGLPNQFIEFLPSLLGSLEPIQFYSCFISYSSKDEEFAQRLYADLQAKGIRCWFGPQELKIGELITPTIDKAIRVHEKLLLIFSDNSITSAWVEKETKEALDKEKETGKKDVLFPIRLDDSILDTTEQWADDVRRERHIGDFTNWKDHSSYQLSFLRLLNDLKSDTS